MNGTMDRQPIAGRFGRTLDRVEAIYLKVLRSALLVLATLLLIAALGWAGVSLYRIARSPSSVQEKPSTVAAADILTSGKVAAASPSGERMTENTAMERAFYTDFAHRYYALYLSRYQPFQRAEDKKLTVGEFDDVTIDTRARLQAVRDGRLDFATDRADLEAFLPVVKEATDDASTRTALSRYKSARKSRIATRVQRMRTESRRGWDSLSSACADWYESPIGCAVTRTVQVPYMTTVTAMKFPDGIETPVQILKGYQNRYFTLLTDRRGTNAGDAAVARADIVAGQPLGWNGLTTALSIAAAFLLLMFFFLLVAIERHQRVLSAEVPARD